MYVCMCMYICMHLFMYLCMYVNLTPLHIFISRLLRMTEFSSICSTKKVASPSIAQNNKSGGDVDAAAVCSLEDNTHNMEDRLGHHLLAGLEWTSWDDFKGLFSADLKTLQSHFGKMS